MQKQQKVSPLQSLTWLSVHQERGDTGLLTMSQSAIAALAPCVQGTILSDGGTVAPSSRHKHHVLARETTKLSGDLLGPTRTHDVTLTFTSPEDLLVKFTPRHICRVKKLRHFTLYVYMHITVVGGVTIRKLMKRYGVWQARREKGSKTSLAPRLHGGEENVFPVWPRNGTRRELADGF